MSLILSQASIDGLKAVIRSAHPFGVSDAPTTEKVRLFKNNVIPGANHLVADFDEADFTGYAAQDLAADESGTAYVDPVSGEIRIQIPQAASGLCFVCSAAPEEVQNIYGYYITNSGGTIVWASERFDAPIPISAVGHAVNIGDLVGRFPSHLTV